MLNKHDLGITPSIGNNSSRDWSLVTIGSPRVYVCWPQECLPFVQEFLKEFPSLGDSDAAKQLTAAANLESQRPGGVTGDSGWSGGRG